MDRGRALNTTGNTIRFPTRMRKGIRGWPSQEWTRSRGAPGELDEKGVLRKVCVIPKPYQQPHPPIFNAFTGSERSLRWAAKVGSIPHILVGYPPRFSELCEIYQEAAAEHGRNLKLGESVGADRYVCIGKTYEEAYQMAVETSGWVWGEYFAPVWCRGSPSLSRRRGAQTAYFQEQ